MQRYFGAFRTFRRVVGLCVVAAPLFLPTSAQAGFTWVAPPGDAPSIGPAGAGNAVTVSPSQPTIQNLATPVIIGGNGNTMPMPTVIQGNGATMAAPAVSTPVNTMAPVPLVEPSMSEAPSVTANPIHDSAAMPEINGRIDVPEVPIYHDPVPPLEPSRPMAIAEPTMPTIVAPPVVMARPMLAPSAGPADTVHGFAKSVPVVVALRQILPAGYAFSIDPSVDMGTLVSFRGGSPWRDTLRDTLAPAGLDFQERGQMVDIAPASALVPIAAVPSPAAAMARVTSVYQPGLEPHTLPSVETPSLPMVAHGDVPVPMVIGGAAPTTVGPSDVKAESAVQIWSAERGNSLHKVLTDWCLRDHVELNWLAEYDYPIDASVNFTGNFQEAIRNLLAGFETAHPQPVAELHTNANLGQMVLIIQARGNTGTD